MLIIFFINLVTFPTATNRKGQRAYRLDTRRKRVWARYATL